MKKIFTILSLFTLALAISNQAFAQGCDAPSSDEGVQVFGYIQPELRTFFYEEPESSFAFRRARLGVMGNIPYDFTYYVLLETSQFMNPNQTGPFLLDAFVSYTRFKYIKVSLGSFKYRFGNELSQACNSLYTIHRSKAIDELTGTLGGGNRDIGLMLLGGDNSTFLQYFVSLTNGYGVFETGQKNNLLDNYMVNGRLIVQPIEGLYIGGSARYSENLPEADGVIAKDNKIRYGVDAKYTFRNFTIWGEYINGQDEGSYMEGGGCGGDPVTKVGYQNADGFYGMLIYRWNNFEPVYKFETYSTAKGEEGLSGTTDNSSFCHTTGINYYPNDWTRIQVNYIYSSEDPKEIKNDALLIQLQVKF